MYSTLLLSRLFYQILLCDFVTYVQYMYLRTLRIVTYVHTLLNILFDVYVGLKNSFSSSDEEDLPSPLNRQQMYLPQTTYPSGYIDTTTHHDLSKAGLDDGGTDCIYL